MFVRDEITPSNIAACIIRTPRQTFNLSDVSYYNIMLNIVQGLSSVVSPKVTPSLNAIPTKNIVAREYYRIHNSIWVKLRCNQLSIEEYFSILIPYNRFIYLVFQINNKICRSMFLLITKNNNININIKYTLIMKTFTKYCTDKRLLSYVEYYYIQYTYIGVNL